MYSILAITWERNDIFSKFLFPLVGECLVKVLKKFKSIEFWQLTVQTQGNTKFFKTEVFVIRLRRINIFRYIFFLWLLNTLWRFWTRLIRLSTSNKLVKHKEVYFFWKLTFRLWHSVWSIFFQNYFFCWLVIALWRFWTSLNRLSTNNKLFKHKEIVRF